MPRTFGTAQTRKGSKREESRSTMNSYSTHNDVNALELMLWSFIVVKGKRRRSVVCRQRLRMYAAYRVEEAAKAAGAPEGTGIPDVE
jgi:hypothetical protein